MGAIGQAIDDWNGGMLRKRLKVLMPHRPQHQRIDIT